VLVNFRPESETFWQISTPSLAALKNDLENSDNINFNFHIEFKRPAREKEGTTHSLALSIPLSTQNRISLVRSLEGAYNFTLNNALPIFVRVPSIADSAIEIIGSLQKASYNPSSSSEPFSFNENMTYSNWSTNLINSENVSRLWIAQLALNQNVSTFLEKNTNYTQKDHKYLQIIAFVDRVFPEIFADYVKTGIVAMYIAVVILIARTLRSLIASQPLDVIINEIPNPDYLMKICQDIYLVREAHDFELEQDLFAKLIFLFRSPSTLIKWTRHAPR